MAATVGLLLAKGVEGFSLREAAAEVGVSPGAAYKHFSDKADLLAAISAEGFAEMAQRVQAAMEVARAKSRTSSRKAVAALEANGLAYVRFATEKPVIFRLMFGPYGACRTGMERDAANGEKSPFELLGEALDGLLEAEVMSAKNREGAELTAWAAVHGLADILINGSMAHRQVVNMERSVQLVVKTLIAGWSV